MWNQVRAVFGASETSSEVVLAQIESYKRRVPILYVILMINVLALAATHSTIAPVALGICVPLAIVAMMGIRLVYWSRMKKNRATEEEARREIGRTLRLGCLLSVAILAWAIALYPYSSGAQAATGAHAHVVLFVGLTAISCAFLMMPVRGLALSIPLIAIPVFSGYLIHRGGWMEIAIATNLLLVAAAVIYVVISYSRDFEHLVTVQGDLSRLNEVNAQLANTDPATGLPNRRRFFTLLSEAVASGKPYAVAVVDLDGFKQINDLHGHTSGDEVLAEIGLRLVKQAPADSCVARMGGDEFALLAYEGASSEMLAIAEDMIDSCRSPIPLRHLAAHVGASVGISMASGLDDPSVSHYERADCALFYAKKGGRGRAELFTDDHKRLTRDSSVVEQALRRADLESEIELVFQPIVRAEDELVVAFEALARWNSCELGLVPPGVFIPVAESNELIYVLTRVILHKALAEAANWPSKILLKINLSVRDLTSPEQMLHLITILRRAQIATHRLTFEITETVLAEDVEAVSNAITSLRAMGAAVAIDDFGVGYSNLSYVQRLSPDLIKIDKSFIDRLGEEGTLGIVKTILELCRNVGASSIAEGVETKDQADILRSVGCHEFQGYYFSRPLSRDAANALANARTTIRRKDVVG